VQRLGVDPTPHLLTVSVARQEVCLFEQAKNPSSRPGSPRYAFRKRYIASTSRYGIGQTLGSNQTPLGLHRIAQKIGGDQPVGTVFKGRKPIGIVGDGKTDESIVHRILWLEGLELGLNQGGDVDTFKRYIYIHGFGDETTLGRPMSRGCVHLAAADLVPLYDRVGVGTLVWIGER
jgi:hypothetical protein